jgi:PDZ domain
MKKFVQLALLALIITGVAAAQNAPPVDIFGGYSYLNLQVPQSGVTNAQSFKLNGYDASAAIGLFHHFSFEADISGHQLTDCGGVSDLKCDDFSYMFGPRYTFGDHSSRMTAFVHGIVGRDQANLLGLNSLTFNDTSIAIAGGAGFTYWFARHVGAQLGPIDIFYTNHLNADGASSQTTYRVAVGIAFRFGGNIPPAQPTATATAKQPAAPKPKTHRSWIRPWHKTVEAPEEGEETTTATATTAPPAAAPPGRVASVPSRGMAIHSLGVVVAPQEFDGAKVVEIEPGSVAEMASLHVGDLIKSIDGKPVRTPMELAAELSEKGGKTRIGIQRGTFVTETTVLLGPH